MGNKREARHAINAGEPLFDLKPKNPFLELVFYIPDKGAKSLLFCSGVQFT